MTSWQILALVLPLVIIAGALGFTFGWAARGRSQPKIARRRRFDASVEGAWRDVERALSEGERITTSKWDSADHLKTTQDVMAYLEAVIAENDEAFFEKAFHDVTRSQWFAGQIAKPPPK